MTLKRIGLVLLVSLGFAMIAFFININFYNDAYVIKTDLTNYCFIL